MLEIAGTFCSKASECQEALAEQCSAIETDLSNLSEEEKSELVQVLESVRAKHNLFDNYDQIAKFIKNQYPPFL